MIRVWQSLLRFFPRDVWIYMLIAGVAWNVVVGTSFVWNVRIADDRAREMSVESARIHYRKDRALRLWAASHGGVYVEVDSTTPPNPYLAHIPERDVQTPSGRQLTLMNPAYMIRQVMDLHAELYGSHGHITSLKPLNPVNAPDAWESQALRRLTAGEVEVIEIIDYQGEPAIRFMRPLVAVADCLPCHQHQGYKVGDIKGGLGTIVSLAPFLARAQKAKRNLAMTHGAIWLLGIAGIVGVAGTASRTVRRQQLQAAETRRSEQKFRIVADNTYDWEFWIDADGRFLYCSPSCQRITGHRAAEFIDDPGLFSRVIHPEDRPRFEQHQALTPDERRGEEVELRIVGADGRVCWVSHVSQPVYDDDGSFMGTRGSNRDITAHKTAQEALLQSSRLVALGQMAAGMAHELNQPLTAISIMAEGMELSFAMGRPPTQEKLRHWAQETVQQVGRMADSIEHLRLFARDQTDEPMVPVDLGEVVLRALKLTRAQLTNHGIDVHVDMDEDLCVFAEPIRLEQVLINLINNARDALVERTGDHGEAPFLSLRGRLDADWVVLEVADNGGGIEASIRDRVFEPFVTTKPAHKGTGLGLSIARTTISDHHGEIDFDSDGGGTVFHMRLPLYASVT